MPGRNLFLGLSSLFLIAAIPMAVYLASQQQSLRSQAFSTDPPAGIRITGAQIIDYRAVSPDVSLVITYPKSTLTPDSFRIANQIPELDNAKIQTFTSPTQTISWQLNSVSPSPTVYLQFRINNQWQTPIFASIPYQKPSP